MRDERDKARDDRDPIRSERDQIRKDQVTPGQGQLRWELPGKLSLLPHALDQILEWM